MPVIEDAGEVINDSVAIMRHLERRTPEPPLFPADPARRAGVDVFIDWFERVYKAAPNAIEDELERDDPDEALVERLGAEMTARLDVFEAPARRRRLPARGELGAADFVAYPFLKYARVARPRRHELFHVILDDHQPLGDSHPEPARLDRAHRRAAARLLTVDRELDELRARSPSSSDASRCCSSRPAPPTGRRQRRRHRRSPTRSAP